MNAHTLRMRYTELIDQREGIDQFNDVTACTLVDTHKIMSNKFNRNHIYNNVHFSGSLGL